MNYNADYWYDLQGKLSEALELVGPALSASVCSSVHDFPASVGQIKNLIDDGEEGYAFLFLCENLSAFKVPISGKAYHLLEDVGTNLRDYWADHPGDFTPNYPPEMWTLLKSQMTVDTEGM